MNNVLLGFLGLFETITKTIEKVGEKLFEKFEARAAEIEIVFNFFHGISNALATKQKSFKKHINVTEKHKIKNKIELNKNTMLDKITLLDNQNQFTLITDPR